MSDTEEETFCFFGKPLEPYDEDEFPKKKPISVEDQIATDAQGRRRFHGAFTGGFSAGFFNTVGSLEGWTPQEFKSTRQDKAKARLQRPEDFMDDEDVGEYGIAPQTVRVTTDYSTSKKRKRMMFAEGPVPGEPVLHTLLTTGNETIGYLLLKNIGIQDKINQHQEELSESTSRVYGCEMPKTTELSKGISVKQYEIPSLYKEYLAKPKAETFGLGYVGLDKSHLSLFKSSSLVVHDKNNKKLSILGQAFGVGAFEDDDDDIYIKDDMTKYDFELTDEKKSKKATTDKKNLLFDMFIQSRVPLINKKLYPIPTIPHSFTGKHKMKKSRFEPIEENESEVVSRHEINPEIRAKYLGEETNDRVTASKSVVSVKVERDLNERSEINQETDAKGGTNRFDISLLEDRFVSASKPEDVRNILESVERTETEHGTQEMRDAVKMKMFGRLTRITEDWCPNPLLCKRFNVPEPNAVDTEKKKKRTKNLIFEYQKHNDDVNLKPGLNVQVKEEPSTSSAEVIESVITTEEPQMIVDLVNETIENDNENAAVTETNKSSEDELIEPKDITEKVNVEENIDLFKEIFLSSSDESEAENDEEGKVLLLEKEQVQVEDHLNEMKANVLSDQLVTKIKPRKEGILSNVNFMKFNQTNRVNDQMESVKETSEEIDNKESLYGPKLPQRVVLPANVNKVTNTCPIDEDEWIEKSEPNTKCKKNKHKKKQKKEKHSKKDKKKKSR